MSLRLFVTPLKHVRRHIASVSTASSELSRDHIRKIRCAIYDEECERQRTLIPRVEKIQVVIKSPPEECTLVMNKDISTPHHCAMHTGEILSKRSVLAMVNDTQWDMHRPLTEDCTLKFSHFKEEDPYFANKAFWRSCCFLLGMVVERAFRDAFTVELHSWPAPNIRSGCFIYDISLDMPDWIPTVKELKIISATTMQICKEAHDFKYLEVDSETALRMFEHNRYKKEQIPKIAASSASQNKITLYRVDDHIDISFGPMIGNTQLVGKFTVSAVYPIRTKDGLLYRFQGVALPQQLPLNHYAYSILIERARKLNTSGLPRLQ